jgi:hypothetical protein
MDSRKSALRHVTLNSCFVSNGICRSRSAFHCVRGAKGRHTIFCARVGPVRVLAKARRDTLRQTCVFTSGGMCGSRSAFRCVRGVKHRHTIFHAHFGPVQIAENESWDKVHQTCIFGSGGIYGSRSALRCVWGAKHQRTIFLAQVDRYGFHKKHMRAAYTELVFLHPVAYVGHVLHFGASGAQNVDALYFMLEWDQCSFHKSTSGQITSNLCFCIRWDLRVT